jgi:hypothetical protein
MDERVSFIADQQSGSWTMTELCQHYEISRKTGYKWLDRYRLEGAAGLMERCMQLGCMGVQRRRTSWMRLWGCGGNGRVGDRARS